MSNVALWQYITEQYNIQIAQWYIATWFLQSADRLHAIWHNFQGGDYCGYIELIEIKEQIYWEKFQNSKILKNFGSFNAEASDFWNFPPNPLIFID